MHTSRHAPAARCRLRSTAYDDIFPATSTKIIGPPDIIVVSMHGDIMVTSLEYLYACMVISLRYLCMVTSWWHHWGIYALWHHWGIYAWWHHWIIFAWWHHWGIYAWWHHGDIIGFIYLVTSWWLVRSPGYLCMVTWWWHHWNIYAWRHDIPIRVSFRKLLLNEILPEDTSSYRGEKNKSRLSWFTL